MKKIVLTLLIMCNIPALAYEDYMMVTSRPIRYVNVQNDDILKVNPLSTIYNEKNVLIVTPKKDGKTKLNVFIGEEVLTIGVEVTESKTSFETTPGFEFYEIDKPGDSNG